MSVWVPLCLLKDEFNFECIMHGLSEIASGFLPFD